MIDDVWKGDRWERDARFARRLDVAYEGARGVERAQSRIDMSYEYLQSG